MWTFRKTFIGSLISNGVVAFCISTTFAQSATTGRIRGTVVDQNSARVVWAEIIVENEATGTKRQTKTDHEGNYVLALLPPGTYLVSIKATGFAPIVFQ